MFTFNRSTRLQAVPPALRPCNRLVLGSLRGAATAALVALGALFATDASALSIRPMTPEQVLANSDMVVVGTVIDSSARWTTPEQSMAVTDYRVRLDRILHDPQKLFGPRRPGDEIVLTFAGGQIGDEGVRIPGIPEFAVGEQAIFLLRGKDLNTVSPVTGANQGLYRASMAADGRRVATRSICTETSGVKVYQGFFTDEIRPKAYGFDEFVAEVERALPIARSRPDLIVPDKPAVPADKEHLILRRDKMPAVTPLNQPSVVGPKTPTALPASDPAEPNRPVPSQAPATRESTSPIIPGPVSDSGSQEEKFRFLWGIPDPPRTYNLPPAYGGWNTHFEYCMSDWNVYSSGTFNKYATGENTFGKNSRNDFVFETAATLQSVYGISANSSLLGMAVMYNSSNNSIQTGQKIYEADVFINADQTWTLDWDTAYNGGGSIWFFRSTVIHEIGHTFGREHTFTEDSTATWNSVMNYVPGGALDTLFYKPFGDDAASIRSAYPARTTSITDMGVYLFRAAGFIPSGGTGVSTQFSTFPSSVQAGASFTLSNYVVENLGTTAQSPTVAFYLSTQRNFSGSYYHCINYNYGSFPSFSQSIDTQPITVPANVPAGQYYIGAYLPTSDGNGFNQSAWSDARITVTAAPAVALSTSSLSPSTAQGSNASSQSFQVRNSGGGTLSYSISDNADWLSVSPTSGSSTGEWDTITVSYSTSALSAGTHNGTITVSGTGTSNGPQTVSVTLTVSAVSGPSNDNFASRATLSSSATGTNVNATAETGEPQHRPGVTPGKSVWWKWTAASNGTLTIDTIGSSFDTVMALYSGSTLSGLTQLGTDDDSGGSGNTSKISNVTVTAGTEYKIAVDGYNSSGVYATGNITLNAAFTPVAAPTPSIAYSPSSLSFSATTGGSSPASQTLNIHNATAGSGTLSYSISSSYESGQPTGWLTVSPTSGSSTAGTSTAGPNVSHTVSANTAGLAAGTYNATLTITSANATNSGQTVPVTFTVSPPGAPSNNSFAGRITLSGDSGSVTGTNVSATAETGEPEHQFGIPPTKSVWWKWTAPSNGLVYFTTLGTGTTFDTFLAVYTGSSVGALTQVGANDNVSGSDSTSLIYVNVTAGTEYQIVVDGSRSTAASTTPEGDIILTWQFTPPPPSIGATPGELAFSATLGGANPDSKELNVYNSTAGSGTLTYSATASYQIAQPSGWLSISPTGGSSTASSVALGPNVPHTVSVNTAGLAAGTYNGAITLNADGAANSPVIVPVTLTVSAFQVMATDTFATADGWGATGGNTASYSTSHDAAGSALLMTVVPEASNRIIGFLEAQAASDSASDHLRFSEIGANSIVRAKFHVYATGQSDPANQNQVPNLRMRISSRFAFSSLLEVMHHNSDVGGTSFSRDLTPSQDSSHPSIYRVDMAPPQLPYLTGNTTEGLQRMFELYSTSGEPQAQGSLALAESTIGVYPAPDTSSTDPSVLIKSYETAADFSRIYYDLRQYERGTLAMLAANINGNNAGGSFGGLTWTGIPDGQVVATKNPGGLPGITLSSAGTPDTIVATAAADWLEGNAEDVDHTLRARVEENKQYVIRFHATASGASSSNALLRFRVRTAKFNYTQRLEVGGAWNLSTWNSTGGYPTRNPNTVSHILAHQYLPGTGGWMDGNPGGAIYDVLMTTPLSKDIRPEVAGTIEERMPYLATEDGPGEGAATRPQGSRRDMFPAVDIIDSLSGSYYYPGTADPQEKGNVTVNRIDIRKYDLVTD